jgi:ATP-dependent helicase/nuclease subunit A
VLGALQPLSEEGRDDDGKLWRFRKGLPVNADQRDQAPQPRAELPAWLTTYATASPRRVRILRPSDAPEEEAIGPAGRGVDRESARLRGRFAHRLLQSLPDIPAARRRKAADNYLARNGRAMSEDDRAQLAERIVALLDDARFRAVFSADSRAEVPIAGTLDGGVEIVRVSGQIDRLAITPDAVLIADFKTNTDPPRRIVEVPDAYKRQLALYRAVLQKIYPGRTVRAALIWTEVPDLMELSAEALDEALRRVTSP